MEVLKVRYTRGDRYTQPGGVIMRKRDDEWIIHNFTRDYGSKTPKDYFWGAYCFSEERAELRWKEKLDARRQYDLGGSLIPDEDVDTELAAEVAPIEENADG